MTIYRLFPNVFDNYQNSLNLFTNLKTSFNRKFILIFYAISLFFLLSCSAQETIHGNKIDEIDIHKIQLNKTTKNDILLEMKKVERLPSSITYDTEKTEAPGVSLGILEQIFFNLQRRQNTE